MIRLSKTLGIFLILLATGACNKEAPAPLPTANFYVENNGCTAPCKVYFYDQSENAVSYEWQFGNGLNSTKENDSSTYTLPGNYEVWLFAKNADDVADSVRKNITIN